MHSFRSLGKVMLLGKAQKVSHLFHRFFLSKETELNNYHSRTVKFLLSSFKTQTSNLQLIFPSDF